MTIMPGPYNTKVEQKKFYNSAAWTGVNGVRQQALKRDNYECQQCKREGYVSVDSECMPGERKTIELNVHHKKEIETHPHLALTLSNLETLCLYHHNVIHNKTFIKKKPKWNDEMW